MTEKERSSHNGLNWESFKRHLGETGLSNATVSAYLDDVHVLLDWLREKPGQGPAIAQMTRTDIIAFLDQSRETGLSVGTINRRLAAIKHLSFWLVREGILEQDIAADVEYARQDEDAAEGRVPTDSQIKKLLDACQHCRHPQRSKAALFLMLHAGLSVEEVVGLTFADFEFASKRSCVFVQGEGQVHRIPIPRTVRQAIEAYQMDERGDDIADHVFVSQKGGQLAAISLRQSLARCFKAAGLTDLTLRSLRGVFVRNYLTAYPADLPGLVRLLRISDWNTLRRYFDLGQAA